MSPIAYCTVWFVIGILTYPHIAPFHAAVPFVVLCMSIICHQKTWRLGFVFCLSLLSWTGGQQWAKLKDPQQNPRHIAHQHDLQNKESIIIFSVRDKTKPSAFNQSYVVKVHQIDEAILSGLALLQLEISSSLSIGENYMTGKRVVNPMALNSMTNQWKARLHSTLKLGFEVFIVGRKVFLRM